jgi:hypothetical protein
MALMEVAIENGIEGRMGKNVPKMRKIFKKKEFSTNNR